jgi:hypothetical protein
MIYDFKNLRPAADHPVYPPYHTGKYLEEYFYEFYITNKNEFDKTGYTLIPIFWTNVYITNINRELIQPYLNALPSGKYFTVSQHDDAVTETLPQNTLSFEAGGNKNGIPIPLICSSLDKSLCAPAPKQLFCSFVGSVIHGSLREQLYRNLHQDKDFYFSPQNWTPSVESSRLNHFIDITKQSIFTLCPRGYGAQSFRIYETLQLNSIPVIIYDKDWFPFNDIINWSEFSVLIPASEIHTIKERLSKISSEQQNEMLKNGKLVYEKYFTLNGACNQILNVLRNK